MNIASAINSAALILAKITKTPRMEAELLLSHILGKDRVWVISRPEYVLAPAQSRAFVRLAKKRSQNFPLAYLTNFKGFFGLDFYVDKHVLVPRPETELMVEEILRLFSKYSKGVEGPAAGPSTPANFTLIDVGTGSGCIAIALAREVDKLKFKDKFQFYGIDISSKALAIAKKNARAHKVENIKFIKGDLLTRFLDPAEKPLFRRSRSNGNSALYASKEIPAGVYALLGTGMTKEKNSGTAEKTELIIAANLPYLTPLQVKSAPSISQEPRSALLAGRDGLKYYRRLFSQINSLRRNCPQAEIAVFAEIDHSQKKSVSALIKKYFPSSPFVVKKDLKGEYRLAIIKVA